MDEFEFDAKLSHHHCLGIARFSARPRPGGTWLGWSFYTLLGCFSPQRVSTNLILAALLPSYHIPSSHQLSMCPVIGSAIKAMRDMHQLRVSKLGQTPPAKLPNAVLQSLFLRSKRFDTSAQRKFACQGCVFVLHIGGETTSRALHTSWPNLSPSDIRCTLSDAT